LNSGPHSWYALPLETCPCFLLIKNLLYVRPSALVLEIQWLLRQSLFLL
jgi:hypothetical protein